MAHELEVIDGVASFFAVRDPAWHQLGQVVREASTAKEALHLAGLDYTVIKSKDNVKVPGFEDLDTGIPGAYATYRFWPDGRVNGLGVVGETYQVVQTWEAAELVEAITDQQHQAIWDTGGSLRNGKQFFMSIKLGEEFTFPGSGDAIETWMVVASSHDGSMALTVYITRIRVVCANTLTWSLSDAKATYKVKHTTNAQMKVTDAREALDLAWDGQDAFSKEIDKLMHTSVSAEKFEKVLQTLIPIEDGLALSNPRAMTLRTKAQEAISDLYYASPTVGAWEGTAYGLWNAVSEYEQWLAPSKGKTDTIDRYFSVAARNVFEAPSNLSRKALALL